MSIFFLFCIVYVASASEFTTKYIEQSNPLAGASNTLTVNVSSNYDLGEGSVLTISGLTNAVAGSSISLTSGSNDGGGLFWDGSSGPGTGSWSGGTLKLTVYTGATMGAGT
eukprot:767351-Hanusia_phi.AAC.2